MQPEQLRYQFDLLERIAQESGQQTRLLTEIRSLLAPQIAPYQPETLAPVGVWPSSTGIVPKPVPSV